ncbi:MAG: hypothetical protein ACRELY_31245 [Polyangiaceae bacterium]
MARYDWTRARRGFWSGRLQIGEPEQRRILDVDLVEAFPDSKSVNEALRKVVKSEKRTTKRRGHAA